MSEPISLVSVAVPVSASVSVLDAVSAAGVSSTVGAGSTTGAGSTAGVGSVGIGCVGVSGVIISPIPVLTVECNNPPVKDAPANVATASGIVRKIDVLTSYPSFLLRLKMLAPPIVAATAPIPRATAGIPKAIAPKEAPLINKRVVDFFKKSFKG